MGHAGYMPRGRLVTPSPGLEAVYTSLGASNTHCDVLTASGTRYTCPSADPYSDSERHRADNYDIIACPSCIPLVPQAAVTLTSDATAALERLTAITQELTDIAQRLATSVRP
jgi:hypothetical protein